MGRKKLTFILICLLGFVISFGAYSQTLEEFIKQAYQNNLGLSALKKIAESEKFLISSKSSPDDPTIAISIRKQNEHSQYAEITQKIHFPVKYYLRGKIQQSRANSYQSEVEIKKLKIREQIISIYYAIYSLQKIIELTKRNIQAVKEFARVAENRYAAGKSSQVDSMKSHFEITQLELDLIRLKQEEESLQEDLKALLNNNLQTRLNFRKKKYFYSQISI